MNAGNENHNGQSFNVKAGCLGMLALSGASALLLAGILCMLGADEPQVFGFVLFIAGVCGLVGFFVFGRRAGTAPRRSSVESPDKTAEQ